MRLRDSLMLTFGLFSGALCGSALVGRARAQTPAPVEAPPPPTQAAAVAPSPAPAPEAPSAPVAEGPTPKTSKPGLADLGRRLKGFGTAIGSVFHKHKPAATEAPAQSAPAGSAQSPA